MGRRPNNPDALTGERRRVVMELYLDGVIRCSDAAEAIGVAWDTVKQAVPDGFDWRLARAQFAGDQIRAALRRVKA